MSNPIIKTPNNKHELQVLVYRMWTPESISWRHELKANALPHVHVTLLKDWDKYVITLDWADGEKSEHAYTAKTFDALIKHLWYYREGLTETGRFDKTILEQACAIEELKISLENITTDDGKELSELTEDEIIAEAQYVLELFNREGTMKYEALVEDEDPDMIRQWHALQSFTARYAS